MAITTVNGNDGVNGITFPATAADYTIIIRSYPSSVVAESSTLKLSVYGTPYFAFGVTALIVNPNRQSIYEIEFEPASGLTHTTSWKIVLHFQTRGHDGKTLFENDLGTGIADSGVIFCRKIDGYSWVPTCTLKHGNAEFSTDTKIEITWTGSSLTYGNRYKLQIFELKNPITPNDEKHINMIMKSYNSGGTEQQSDFFYDFTVRR